MRLFLILAYVLVVAQPARSAVFMEMGDAGETLADYQSAIGFPVPLDVIIGQIQADEFVDLYRIHIQMPSLFSASTVNDETLGLDTQLFLFDLNGNGIAANDDVSNMDSRSLLPQGDPLYASRPPGDYLLGISTFDSDPIGITGDFIFPDAATGVLGAEGFATKLGDWFHDPASDFGPYRIDFTGAAFVSEPAVHYLLASGMLFLLAVRRRRRVGSDPRSSVRAESSGRYARSDCACGG